RAPPPGAPRSGARGGGGTPMSRPQGAGASPVEPSRSRVPPRERAMNNNKKILAAASLAVCAACGGGDGSTFATGTATLTGAIGGQPMTGRDAVSVIVGAGTAQSAALMVLTNAANQCSLFTNHQAVRNAQVIVLGVGTQSGTTSTAPVVGSYPIYTAAGSITASGPVAVAQFATTDASCHTTTPVPVEATTG